MLRHVLKSVAPAAAAVAMAVLVAGASPARAAVPPLDIVPMPLATGDDHTCGISAAGAAYCWGIDNFEQLGNGAALAGNQISPTAVDVSALPPNIRWAAISAADLHTCGLTTEGDIYCWGSDSTGQLGNGPASSATQSTPSPLDVTGLPAGTTFVDIAVGEAHTCAVAADGAAYCWGSDGQGQLGNGDALAETNVPTPLDMTGLPAGTGWQSISAGSIHTCAVSLDGDAYCWGIANNGRLGTGDLADNRQVPTPITMTALPAGTKWAWAEAGDNHSCGITTDGDAWCWGRDNLGQLGNGATWSGNQNPTPLPVTTVLDPGVTWDRITVGDELTCATTSTSELWCWGNTPDLTGTSPRKFPADRVPAGTTFTFATVATSATHACAQSAAGTAYCWGSDQFGQIGNGPAGYPYPLAAAIAYPGGPDPVVPEVPYPVLLSAVAALAGGALVVRQSRRQAIAA